MILTDQHLEAIKAAALPIDYGSITIEAGADHLDIIVSRRIRLPKETAKRVTQKTGETLATPPRRRVVFRPGQEPKTALRGPFPDRNNG